MDLLLQLPILLFSVIIHEFAHGYTAHKMGDDTAYLSGRLTFNPLAHIDPIGTVVFPLICYFSGMPLFGWAKPVPVNPYRLNNPSKDMIKVAASGALSNVGLAIVCAILFKIALLSSFILGTSITSLLLKALRFGVIINFALAFFNLIPIAPLDGSKVMSGLLPLEYAQKYERHTPYGMWILVGLFITGFIRYLIIPPVIFALNVLAFFGLRVF
ncbi:MAG TPA: site-2 protease family protein [Elusimicrobiales bacterium]|nr:site-2 protease family protein [Elusimicrobiales bacterium]